MKIIRYLLIFFFAIAVFFACEEEGRFAINSNDKTIPGKPVVTNIVPLDGGARIFYTVPPDEQLLQVVAEITATNGKTFKFSASYYKDSLDVWGLGDTVSYTFNIWAETRAGTKSAMVPVTVKPKTSSIWHVKNSIEVQPGFGALCVNWKNELKQTIHVYVDLDFNLAGAHKQLGVVYSSNSDSARQVIPDLPHGGNINVKVHVQDIYGNATDFLVENNLGLLQDNKILKRTEGGDPIWKLPQTNDSIDWIPMCFGDGANGRLERVWDDLIDYKMGASNFMHAQDRGRTGVAGQGNIWNLLIDLGGYWHISRLITHQRWDFDPATPRSRLYQNENVGHFALWVLDEDQPGDRTWNIYGEEISGTWVKLSDHYIPIPTGLANYEYIPLGNRGDESYMFPFTPGYTKAVRWFRYEAISAFDTANGVPYGAMNHNCLSEVTLYGLPAGTVDESKIVIK